MLHRHGGQDGQILVRATVSSVRYQIFGGVNRATFLKSDGASSCSNTG